VRKTRVRSYFGICAGSIRMVHSCSKAWRAVYARRRYGR
jgi:hypothetical protein